VDSWQAFYNANAAHLAAVTNPPPQQAQQIVTQPVHQNLPQQNNSTTTTVKPAKPTATVGTYSVKSGDTPAAIARKYGVKLDALLAANPGLDAKHLKIGRTVTIPSP
jgi:LysM repeat protein